MSTGIMAFVLTKLNVVNMHLPDIDVYSVDHSVLPLAMSTFTHNVSVNINVCRLSATDIEIMRH